MKTTHTEKAVSPVIGVILMVAITVILAAVIAAYIFGLVGTTNTTKIVAVSAKQINNSAISIVILGGPDVDSLTKTTVSGDIISPGTIESKIGSRKVFLLSEDPGPKNILVLGSFSDGTDQVLLDSNFIKN